MSNIIRIGGDNPKPENNQEILLYLSNGKHFKHVVGYYSETHGFVNPYAMLGSMLNFQPVAWLEISDPPAHWLEPKP